MQVVDRTGVTPKALGPLLETSVLYILRYEVVMRSYSDI